MPKIPVLEIFGPTIQGEGAVIGQKRCLLEQVVVIIDVVGAIQVLHGMALLKMIFDYLNQKILFQN